MNALIFIKFNAMTLEDNPFMVLQSTDNLEAKVPALFSGLSKNDTGNLSSFAKASYLILNVSFSPMQANKMI